MKKIFLYIVSGLTLAALSSCEKFVDVPAPENQLISDVTFQSATSADAAVAGLYSIMNSYNYQFANFIGNGMPAFSADEFHYALSSSGFNEFKDNNLSPGNSYVRTMWTPVYNYVYHANAILEGLDKSTTISDVVKKQLAGEARFLRAFYYFYLVNYFGDVPLILTTDYKANTVMPRTPAADVYNAIVADLKQAQADLDDDYPTTERIRANKAAATALLARTYLYRQQWSEAETEATKVINDNRYELLTDLDKIFLKNSNETILQLQSVNKSTAGVNTWEGFNIVPFSPTGRAYYHVYDSFLNAFETGDQRKNSWIKSYTNASGTFFYPYKYKVRTAAPVQEYSMVLRLAEQYLIRAEARAQQNNLAGAAADLNAIRQRAGLEPLPDNLDKAAMLLAVEQERRIELFAEWGHRWFDLRRTGRSLAVLSPIKPDLTATDLWYPIPLSAINTNPFLTQNEGY